MNKESSESVINNGELLEKIQDKIRKQSRTNNEILYEFKTERRLNKK